MKTKKIFSVLLSAAMLMPLVPAALAAEPITADEVKNMLFAENITTVSDSDKILESEYSGDDGEVLGAVSDFIQPEQAIMIHKENSDGSPSADRSWLIKSGTDWDGWYYLYAVEGKYDNMLFDPVAKTEDGLPNSANSYLNTIDDITDFEKIADALKDVEGITSIRYTLYYQKTLNTDFSSGSIGNLNGFKIESADGLKYLPITVTENPFAAVADGEFKALDAWTVYDGEYIDEFMSDIAADQSFVNESICKDLGADYPFSDAPIEDTDTLSKYIGTECAFPDIETTGDNACTPENIAAVNALADLGFMQGYEDKTFRPQNTVTRAEAAIMAYKLLGLDENSPRENELTDISGHWAEEAIGAVAAAGIINGYEDKSFRPDEQIEYRHFLLIMVCILDGWTMSDLPEDMAITQAISAELTKDIGDFDPADKMPRIHAASAAARLLDAHLETNRFEFRESATLSGGSYDITIIDYLNGKELHGLDLRLKYNNEKYSQAIKKYQDIIRSGREEYLNKAGSSETV